MASSNTILYVDDDEDDLLFLSETIQQISPLTNVIHVGNGLLALEYLNKIKEHSEKLPRLVVLDLNMPILNGKETYDKMKQDPILSKLPVVILTSSQNPNDKASFNQMGLTFMSKPHNISFMDTIAKDLLAYCT